MFNIWGFKKYISLPCSFYSSLYKSKFLNANYEVSMNGWEELMDFNNHL
jgi:hypothetical protein